MNTQTQDKLVALATIIAGAVGIVLWASVSYVLYHFIQKLW
jgi:hypothetical protein